MEDDEAVEDDVADFDSQHEEALAFECAEGTQTTEGETQTTGPAAGTGNQGHSRNNHSGERKSGKKKKSLGQFPCFRQFLYTYAHGA